MLRQVPRATDTKPCLERLGSVAQSRGQHTTACVATNQLRWGNRTTRLSDNTASASCGIDGKLMSTSNLHGENTIRSVSPSLECWPPYATDFGLFSMCKSGTFFSACKPKLVSHRACRKNVLDLHVEKTSWICTREKSLDFQIAPHKEASMKTTRYAPGMHDMGLG